MSRSGLDGEAGHCSRTRAWLWGQAPEIGLSLARWALVSFLICKMWKMIVSPSWWCEDEMMDCSNLGGQEMISEQRWWRMARRRFHRCGRIGPRLEGPWFLGGWRWGSEVWGERGF